MAVTGAQGDPGPSPDGGPQDGAGSGGGRRSPVVAARRAATKRSLVRALEELLATRSYTEVTIEDVMASPGLTRTAFYRYFPDLEAVLLAGLVEVQAELAAAAEIWFDPGGDPEAGLDAAAVAVAVVYQRHGRMLLALADAAVGGGRVQEAWHDLVDGFVEPVRDRLEALDHPDTVPVGEVARALVWMLERYLLETYGRGRDVTPEVAGAVVAHIWRAAMRPAAPGGGSVRPGWPEGTAPRPA